MCRFDARPPVRPTVAGRHRRMPPLAAPRRQVIKTQPRLARPLRGGGQQHATGAADHALRGGVIVVARHQPAAVQLRRTVALYVCQQATGHAPPARRRVNLVTDMTTVIKDERRTAVTQADSAQNDAVRVQRKPGLGRQLAWWQLAAGGAVQHALVKHRRAVIAIGVMAATGSAALLEIIGIGVAVQHAGGFDTHDGHPLGIYRYRSYTPPAATSQPRGASMITSMPARHSATPAASPKVGRTPSTAHSHNNATLTYTPP